MGKIKKAFLTTTQVNMQFTAASVLAFLATTVSANTYTLYCGDSCTTGTAVSTGSDYAGADCTALDTAYPYCYLVSDESAYKAIVSKETGCIETNGAEQVIWPGDCFEGPWESFQVSVNL